MINITSTNLLGVTNIVNIDVTKFPAKELQVQVNELMLRQSHDFTINCYFDGSDDIVLIGLTYDAIKRGQPYAIISLNIPYFPAARQDRTETSGESFGLKVYADMINQHDFNRITVLDAHSDVLAGMFPAGRLNIITQLELFKDFFYINSERYLKQNIVVVSPDNGANKKAAKIAKWINQCTKFSAELLQAEKVRDYKTGRITKTVAPLASDNVNPRTFLVVDDICDGGGTFIALHDALKPQLKDRDNTILWTAHGIYSKGKAVLSMYDLVTCYNDMSKEQ